MDLFQQGTSAFVDEAYGEAISLYSSALGKEPNLDAKILDARANAHLKLENWLNALEDAVC
jgi:hypothetical protein